MREEPLFVVTPLRALAPMNDAARELTQRHKVGTALAASWSAVRNAKFHRKFFALLKLGFDHWEAPRMEYRGEAVEANFERFRKDVTILAGHYVPVVNLRGEVRLEAKSIAFSRMNELEFNDLYRDVFNVLWSRVLQSSYASPEEVERVLNEMMAFE